MDIKIKCMAPVLMLGLVIQPARAEVPMCAKTLEVINRLYNNLVTKCEGSEGTGPLTDCSGLIIRGAKRPEASSPPQPAGSWYIWNPSPRGQELGTTAASWMRKDVNYESPGVGHRGGYIVTPVSLVPKGEPKSEIACISPLDFWSDFRNDQGCGDNKDTTDQVEQSCQAEKIDGENWYRKKFDPFADSGANIPRRGQKLCAFYMKDGYNRVQAAESFLKARKSIETTFAARESQTELRFYHPKVPNTQSILAFFCTNDAACADAVLNRKEYFEFTGFARNIIKIKFPDTQGDKATFSCDEATDGLKGMDMHRYYDRLYEKLTSIKDEAERNGDFDAYMKAEIELHELGLKSPGLTNRIPRIGQ